ncbi:hypothetical protein E1287_27865 [Actinomadura sp. KC06]|uniref:Hsp70 family protein n=1 Tax=Actinomadura sp. KC06 TaxID=2530369 RepID=UPI00104EC7A2|nr:Hsp70 family protein [Actinomadura sp. KC06]TDD31053.1 hypothetical protein E1287_27865 [Actinomadura sp. KC06]
MRWTWHAGEATSGGGVFSKIIERNTTMPTKYSELFVLADGGSSAAVHIYEGEHEIAAENTLLGAFHLTGLPPSGDTERLEITIDVDANGIMFVTAKDVVSGKEASLHLRDGGSAPVTDADAELLPRLASQTSEAEAAGSGPG